MQSWLTLDGCELRRQWSHTTPVRYLWWQREGASVEHAYSMNCMERKDETTRQIEGNVYRQYIKTRRIDGNMGHFKWRLRTRQIHGARTWPGCCQAFLRWGGRQGLGPYIGSSLKKKIVWFINKIYLLIQNQWKDKAGVPVVEALLISSSDFYLDFLLIQYLLNSIKCQTNTETAMLLTCGGSSAWHWTGESQVEHLVALPLLPETIILFLKSHPIQSNITSLQIFVNEKVALVPIWKGLHTFREVAESRASICALPK